MDQVRTDRYADALTTQRKEWQQRLEAIRRDRRRTQGALDPDFAEQAVQRENDETLDALDQRGHRALSAIDAALARIEAGSYGVCTDCGDEIEAARLEIDPTAVACAGCANAGSPRAARKGPR